MVSNKIFYGIFCVALIGCDVAKVSKVNEAPDQYSRADRMGIDADFTWEELRGLTQYQAPQVWSGDGWAYTQQELAQRWGAYAGADVSFSQKPIMEANLKDFWNSFASTDQSRLFLSPAEKYDYLQGAPFQPSPELETKVNASVDQFTNELEPRIASVNEELNLILTQS